jgi:hypothetical protein
MDMEAQLPLRPLIHSVINSFKLGDSELLSNVVAFILAFVSVTSRPIRSVDYHSSSTESQYPMLQLSLSHFSHIFD